MDTKAMLLQENDGLRQRVADLEQQLATCLQEKGAERFRSLFEHAPVAYQSLDEQGNFTEVNPAYCQLIGYSAADLLGTSFGDLWTPATRAGFPEAFARLKQLGCIQADLQLVHQNGTLIEVVLDGSVQRDVEGKFIRTHCILHDVTERKRTETAMRESEERFATLFRSNPTAAGITRQPNLEIVEVNDAWCQLTGYPREQALGQTSTELGLATPETLRRVREELAARGTIRNFEISLFTRSGEERQVLMSADPIHLGGEACILSNFIDITERNRANAVLQESETRFSQAFFTSPISQSIVTQATNEIVAVNEACCVLFGYSREELIGAHTAKLNLWENPADRLAAVEELQRTGHLLPREATIRVKSGVARTVIAAMEPISWQGSPCFISFLVDITERKQNEKLMRQWGDAFENCAHGIAIGLPTTNNILTCNPAFASLQGRTREEISSMSILSMYAPEDHEHVKRQIAEADRKGSQRYEARMLSKDGTRYPVQMDVVSVRDESGKLLYRVATQQDITERKQAEEKLHASETLLRQVIESTKDAIFAIDQDHHLLINNERHQQVLVATGGHRFQVGEDVLPPDYPTEVLDDWRAMYDRAFSGVSSHVESAWTDIDGNPRTYENEVSPLADATGRIIGAMVVAHDITERKRLERNLRESELRYTLLFQKLSIPVFLIKLPEVIISDTNEAAEKLTGFKREEMLGRNAAELGLISHRQRKETIAQYEKDRGLAENEMRILAKTGEERLILVNTNPLEINGQPFAITSMQDITERKRAEEKLRESRETFQMLFNLSPVAYSLTKVTDREIVDVNQAWERLFGYPKPEVVGKPATEFDFWARPNERGEAFEKLLQQGRLSDFEFSYKTKSGALGWALSYAEIFEQGDLKYIISGFIDITARKDAEAQVRLKDRLLHMTSTMANIGGWEFDVLTKQGVWTDEVARIHGLDPAQETNVMLGLSFYAGESRVAIEKAINEAIAEGKPYDLTLDLVDAVGVKKWIRTMGLPILENNEVVKVQGIFQDITERKRWELALKASEENYRSLAENAESAIAVLNREGKVLYANPWALQLWKSGGLLGKTVFELFPDELAIRYQAAIQKVIDTRDGILDEIETTVNSQTAWFRVNMLPLKNPDGSVNALLLNAWDITTAKLADGQLRESHLRYQTLFENSPVAIWEEDFSQVKSFFDQLQASGVDDFAAYFQAHPEAVAECTTLVQIIDVNHAALNLMEVQEKGALKQVLALSKDLSAFELFKQELLSLAQGERFFKGEETIRTAAGSLKDVLVHINVAPGFETTLGKVIVSILDITTRKQAEKELRQSEKRFAAILENTPLPIGISRLSDGKAIEVNTAFTRLLGYTREEVLDHTTLELNLWGNPADRQLIIEKLSRNELVRGFETTACAKSGAKYVVLVSGEQIEINAEPCLMLQLIDITDRKQAEQEIRQANERFTQIAEAIREVFWMYDEREQRLVYLSPAYESIWGRSIQSLYTDSRLYVEALISEDRPIMLAALEKQAQGKPVEMEYRIVRPDGELRWIHDRSFPIFDNIGHLIRTTGIAADITERKRAETSLEQRLEDLALINRLNEAVNHGKDIVMLTQLLATEAQKIFGSQYASVFLINPETQTLVLQQFTIPQARIKQLERLLGRPIPKIDLPIDGNDHFSQVLNSDRGLHITGTEEINRWLADFINTSFLPAKVRPLIRKLIPAAVKLLNFKAVISIPLKAGDETLGLIEFVTEGMFAESAIDRLQNVRHQLAEVIIRQRVEQSLRESNENYRLLSEELEERVRQRTAEVTDLYDRAPNGYHSLDADGRIIMMNQTELDWLGYSQNELIGQPFARLFTPASLTIFQSIFPIFKQRGWAHDIELELIRKDGSTFPVLVSATAIKDEAGNFAMSRSTVFDNTERKKAEQTLRESEASLQNFLDTANDLIQSLDESGNYLYVNNAWCHTLGYSVEEALHLSMFDVVAPEHHAACREQLQKLVVGEEPERLEVVFKTKQGQEVIVEGHVNSRTDKEGRVATNGIFRDITLRKRAEEVLRESEAQLRLSRDRLSAANAALEKAARMKDEFLASMSHELRTPLTGILGLSEAMQLNTYGILTEKQSKALKNIEESGRHLLALINDILDLSKIEAGMLELEIEPVSLAEICQASQQLTKGMAHKKRQSVDFSMSPNSISVRGDARRLKQMLVNLLSNAIKFTPENGSLGLEVQADKTNQLVRLTVWDTGIGIAPENLEKLFQPFVQLESSLARQYEGTGLGLSLVQRMAELHGGSIQVESALGQGSRFTILLPWMPEETQPLPISDREARVLKKALIVDDSEIDAGQLTRYLHILGMETTVHMKGQETVETAALVKPDVILLDLHLPDQSGFDVLTELKANSATRAVPVVICSVEERRSQAISLGAAGYLVKPLTITELRNEMNRVAALLGQIPATTPSPDNPAKPIVLIVDDNEMIIETISDFLESQNFQVMAARSGVEMLDVVPDLHPAIILMDIQMPVMDGLEATQRIRAHADPVVARVPIIALTALAMIGDRERCLAAGANEYMSKPLGLKQLVETIHDLLEKKITS